MSSVFRAVEDPHGYFLGNESLPSPSAVFQDLGLVDPRWFKTEHRMRGKAVHAGLHFALKGTLEWRTLNPELHGYVKSGLRFVERLNVQIIRFETPFYHPGLHFAGTLDAEIGNQDWREIWDWKTGKAPNVTRYQTAAYEMLARLQSPSIIRWRRAAIELQADGSIANLVRYQDHTDGAGWLNLLGTYRIRQALRAGPLAYVPQGEENHVTSH